MNPRVPDILSRVLETAARTLNAPTGDLRRLDAIEQLVTDVHEGRDWATDEPRRYLTDWTLMLVKMLRIVERSGAPGEAIDRKCARAVAAALLPHVQNDMIEAMRVAARAAG